MLTSCDSTAHIYYYQMPIYDAKLTAVSSTFSW